jgi:hypothetical protein
MKAVFLQVVDWLGFLLDLIVESFITGIVGYEGNLHEWR